MNNKYQSSGALAYWIIGLITVAVLALIIVLAFTNSPASLSSKTNREVALTCTTDMATQFHIHPVLKIVINGQPQEIPADIGIKPNCMNSLHTHDATGIIHVEASEKRDFTLADFFAVWDKVYNKNQIFDYKTDENHVIRQTVNGKEAEDFENTVLKDKDEIIIYYEEKKS